MSIVLVKKGGFAGLCITHKSNTHEVVDCDASIANYGTPPHEDLVHDLGKDDILNLAGHHCSFSSGMRKWKKSDLAQFVVANWCQITDAFAETCQCQGVSHMPPPDANAPNSSGTGSTDLTNGKYVIISCFGGERIYYVITPTTTVSHVKQFLHGVKGYFPADDQMLRDGGATPFPDDGLLVELLGEGRFVDMLPKDEVMEKYLPALDENKGNVEAMKEAWAELAKAKPTLCLIGDRMTLNKKSDENYLELKIVLVSLTDNLEMTYFYGIQSTVKDLGDAITDALGVSVGDDGDFKLKTSASYLEAWETLEPIFNNSTEKAFLHPSMRAGGVRGVKKHVVKIDETKKNYKVVADDLTGFKSAHSICLNVANTDAVSFRTCLENMNVEHLTKLKVYLDDKSITNAVKLSNLATFTNEFSSITALEQVLIGTMARIRDLIDSDVAATFDGKIDKVKEEVNVALLLKQRMATSQVPPAGYGDANMAS